MEDDELGIENTAKWQKNHNVRDMTHLSVQFAISDSRVVFFYLLLRSNFYYIKSLKMNLKIHSKKETLSKSCRVIAIVAWRHAVFWDHECMVSISRIVDIMVNNKVPLVQRVK